MTTPAAPAPAAPVIPSKAPVPTNGVGKPPPVALKPAAAAVPAPPAAEGVDADPVIWEGKVDGATRKVKKSEADRYLSKGANADKATQVAKEAIKRAQQVAAEVEAREKAFNERLKTDLAGVLKERGIEFDEAAIARLDQKVAEGKMTPAEREAAALKAENARLKGDQEKLAKQQEEARNQQATSQLQRRIETELVSAAKRANLSLGDESFYAIYESFREAYELGLLPADANGLMPHDADRIVEDAMEKLSGAQKNLRENALKLDGQPLEDYLGEAVADKLMRHRLEKIRSRQPGYVPGSAAKPAPQQAPPAVRPSSYLTPAEADAQMKKLAGR